jgi:hypothetical protein
MPSDLSLPEKRFHFPYRTTRGISLRINPFGALPLRIPQTIPGNQPREPASNRETRQIEEFLRRGFRFTENDLMGGR